MFSPLHLPPEGSHPPVRDDVGPRMLMGDLTTQPSPPLWTDPSASAPVSTVHVLPEERGVRVWICAGSWAQYYDRKPVSPTGQPRSIGVKAQPREEMRGAAAAGGKVSWTFPFRSLLQELFILLLPLLPLLIFVSSFSLRFLLRAGWACVRLLVIVHFLRGFR